MCTLSQVADDTRRCGSHPQRRNSVHFPRIVSPTFSSGERERSRVRLHPSWSFATRQTYAQSLTVSQPWVEKGLGRKTRLDVGKTPRPFLRVKWEGGPCLIKVVTHLLAPSSDHSGPHAQEENFMRSPPGASHNLELHAFCRSAPRWTASREFTGEYQTREDHAPPDHKTDEPQKRQETGSV